MAQWELHHLTATKPRMILGVYERPQGDAEAGHSYQLPFWAGLVAARAFVAVVYSVSANTDSRTSALTQVNRAARAPARAPVHHCRSLIMEQL